MTTNQSNFTFSTWGGPRRGAGRKPSGPRRNVPHHARPSVKARHPVHVTWRFERLPDSLRSRRAFRVVRDALIAGCERFETRLVHFSVQSNHLHVICEAADATSLSRALKGLAVRIARGLNRMWSRAGRVIADRYHAHELRTPREVRNALAYVLHNARHHGYCYRGPDPCSSSAGLGAETAVESRGGVRATSPWPRARTWLLRVGWRRSGDLPGLLDPGT